MGFVILHHRFSWLFLTWCSFLRALLPLWNQAVLWIFQSTRARKQIQALENKSGGKKNDETTRNIFPNEAAVAPNTENVPKARGPGNNHIIEVSAHAPRATLCCVFPLPKPSPAGGGTDMGRGSNFSTLTQQSSGKAEMCPNPKSLSPGPILQVPSHTFIQVPVAAETASTGHALAGRGTASSGKRV